MAEHILSVEKIDYTSHQSATEDFYYDISTPFTATISPEIIFGVEEVQQSSLTINVQGGLAQAGSSGSGKWTLTVNSISLKSSNTIFASANIHEDVMGDHSSGEMVGTQLVISNPTAFLKALSTQSVSIVMNFTSSATVWGGWTPRIYVAEQSISITTTGQLIITANSPQQVCGEVTPTFQLSGTVNKTPDSFSPVWYYHISGDPWYPVNSDSPSLNCTWIIDDAKVRRGETYELYIMDITTRTKSNTVLVTLYDPPSIPDGVAISPNFGGTQTYIRLSTTPVTDPSNGICPLQYQWQYNNGSPDEWVELEGATSIGYRGQFTATTPETRFRLRVIGAGGEGYSDPVTFTAYYPTFPLNVEIGSPQYTTVSQINYSEGAGASVQVTPATSGTTPVSNSYYTFQSQDGQYWMTAYVGKWTNNDGKWTADLIWSSSNTDTLPAQSICWCVWTKEYYQSIIDRLSS